jgi:hypothetical protein
MADQARSKIQVLSDAITCAEGESPDTRLTSANFGQYAAAGSGWWWELTFSRTYGNARDTGAADTFRQRCERITQSWHAAVTLQERDGVTLHEPGEPVAT